MLQGQLKDNGLDSLVDELKRLDFNTWETIDLKNPKRVLRALEIIHQTGKRYSVLKSRSRKSRNFNILKIGLDMPRADLFDRINQRVDRMLEAGLLEEVKSLRQYRDLTALQTVGYTEFFEYLDGKYDLGEAVRLCKRNTRRYAKRQLTWFRKDKSIHWFAPESSDKIMALIRSFLVS
jgi:tRNA dimethylallyltransferase